MSLKRGAAVWILGFFTFLAAVNVVNAVILWRLESPYYVVDLYLVGDVIGNLLGNMQVSTYLWASITATFIFFGLTAIVAFQRVPPDPAIVRMLVKLGGRLAATKKVLETTSKDLYDGLENGRLARERLFTKAGEQLENVRQEMTDGLAAQSRTIQKVRKDAVSAIETNLGSVRKELSSGLEKQAGALKRVTSVSEKNAASIRRQMTTLADMQTELERLEAGLASPQPMLTSRNSLEEVKGIGSGLGKELRSLGLTNVGELIATDPEIIAEKTRPSAEMVERLQQRALLLMVPGVDESDVELLKEVGVTSRKELVEQDPVLLSRRLEEVAKSYVAQGKITKEEKPTIEEISSWIKNARP